MLNLVRNENMKLYRRPRTWILVGILVALVVAVSLIMKTSENRNPADWREAAQQDIAMKQQMLNDSRNAPGFTVEEFERSIAISQYRLEHDIPPADHTVWGKVLEMTGLIQIVTIFTVVIAADIVAGEFASGTIKLLLIRPASRSKILLSKYLSTTLFSFLMLVVLFLTSFVLNGFLYGFTDVGTPYIYASKDMEIHESNMLLHVLSSYGLRCVELVMIVTLAFMISTVFRSSSLAISLSLLLLFLGQAITMFFSQWSWGKYWLFANTNLTQYIEGRPLVEGMTMPFSVVMLIAYFLLFNALTWSIFNRRDVAA